MITSFNLFENLKNKNFEIPEQLRKNNKIVNNTISTIQMWKTKVILANSAPEDIKIGDWDHVGYIMINYKTNQIIPIARADEHHTGYDLMHKYLDENIIEDINDWTAIFWGNNYFYYNDENDKNTKQDYIACQKYIDYGGNNTSLLISFHDKKHTYRRINIDIKTFIDLKGNLNDIKEFIDKHGEISEKGENLIDFFEITAIKLKKYHTNDENDDPIWNNSSPKDFSEYVKWQINDQKVLNDIKFINTLYYKNEILKACNKFDIDKIEKLLFSHNGLKNTIHQELRKGDNDDLKKYFKNVKLALSKFNMLSNI